MSYFPKDDFIYDHNKTRAENYLRLRKSVEEDADPNSLNKSWKNRATRFLAGFREFKGAHLDWNYTEMVRDLIDQGLVKVPISDIEVIFVEWAAGNLDNVKREFKYEKAWFDWDGKEWSGCYKPGYHGGVTLWWEKRNDLVEAHFYNDSNREEYIPTPIMNVEQIPQQIEYGNHDEPNFIPWQEREHTAFWVTGVAE